MFDALTPLDGRYSELTHTLRPYLSESALNAYRLHVEVRWLLHLYAWKEKNLLPLQNSLSSEQKQTLESLANSVLEDRSFAQRVKEFEAETRHDVKAMEYTLVEHLKLQNFDAQTLSLVHFACTSEDINNLAYALMLRDAIHKVILPQIDKVLRQLNQFALQYADMSMISRTHGQKATPTTLGKEFAVFAYRLRRQRRALAEFKMTGKINGATGNYAAHYTVFPETSWEELAKEFVESKLALEFHPMTTQIEPHDTLVEVSAIWSHLSSIGIDLCRDMWGYISFGYLKQRMKSNEVGSSTMPHKVNPIDFENAEGNFGLAIALSQHIAIKLPISRFQRDLSDSTVLRSFGTLLGHLLVGLLALERGLCKIEADGENIRKDLDGSWELLGEALQTALRASGVSDAYERIKKATRGQSLGREEYLHLIDSSAELSEDMRSRLRDLTPQTYTGCAAKLVQKYIGE